MIPADAITLWSLIGYYLVLQIIRYWVIGSLGRYWTHRIITLPKARMVTSGPYGYLETFVLPLTFGALALAAIMTALWWTVLT